MSDAETTQPVPARAIAVETPVAKPVAKREVITRRLFILGGFFSMIGLAVVGVAGTSIDLIWPRNIKGFGGPINVTPDRIPAEGGDPIVIPEGKFFILNLAAGETSNGVETPGGVLALWRKCPHLGCSVPYNPSFEFNGVQGWFRCPCHNSTYSKDGGVIVFGPAPRPLDVFPVEVQGDGSLVVQTGRQFENSGNSNNAARAVPLEPGNTTPEL